jgi:hypothetical protein
MMAAAALAAAAGVGVLLHWGCIAPVGARGGPPQSREPPPAAAEAPPAPRIFRDPRPSAEEEEEDARAVPADFMGAIKAEVESGGPDPESNTGLQFALRRARASGMPDALIDRELAMLSNVFATGAGDGVGRAPGAAPRAAAAAALGDAIGAEPQGK